MIPVQTMAGQFIIKIISGNNFLVALNSEGGIFTIGMCLLGELSRPG